MERHVFLPKTTPFAKNYFCECSKCKKVNVYVSHRNTSECKYCGESIRSEVSEYFIEPIHGFKTGPTKESTRLKPKRSYAGEVTYLNKGKSDDDNLAFGTFMMVESSSEDELLVMNRSNFYMCPICGYSDIAKRNDFTPREYPKTLKI